MLNSWVASATPAAKVFCAVWLWNPANPADQLHYQGQFETRHFLNNLLSQCLPDDAGSVRHPGLPKPDAVVFNTPGIWCPDWVFAW